MSDDTKNNNNLYFLLIFLIGAISAYDNYLTHKYSDNIMLAEKNPIGLGIIKHYGVSFFITIKAVGTIISTILSFCLMKTKYRSAIWGVFLWQVLLFFYLTFYVPDGFFRDDILSVWGQ